MAIALTVTLFSLTSQFSPTAGGQAVTEVTTLSGPTITEYQYPAFSGITSGPDGAIWFTESIQSNPKIGRIDVGTTSLSEFSVPASTVNNIAPGPDGALWFTDEGKRQIGRITVGGGFSAYPVPWAG